MMRILVADDHEVLRWGLVQSLSTQPDMVVVGEVADAAAAVAAFARLAPDILILDLYMPAGGGWFALEQVLASQPEACVVMLTAADDAATVRAATDRGAKAHVSKSDGIARLLEVLRSVGVGSRDEISAAASADRPRSPQAPSGAGGGDAGP